MKNYTLDLKDDYRIIVISDIHGHPDEFTCLLKKLNPTKDDLLIILGDFINRGYDSYKMLKIIRELSEKKNTLILKGNHERFQHSLISSYENFLQFEDFMRNGHYETLFHSMLRNSNLDIDDFQDFRALYDHLTTVYKEDFDFLSNLHTMAECDDFIFVHGGYDADFDFTDESLFLKYDNYDTLSKINKKTIVVGHWPACNLRMDVLSNEPFFNHHKNIITVDGGMGVKSTGELNALVIDKHDGKFSYDLVQQNNFKEKKIIKTHEFQEENTVYVNYPHFDIEVLRKDAETSLCLHKFSGREFTLFNCFLDENGEKPEIKICYVNNFLNLEKGSSVNVVSEYGDYVLVKSNRDFGWIMKYQIEQ